jgi:hypothetical protein
MPSLGGAQCPSIRSLVAGSIRAVQECLLRGAVSAGILLDCDPWRLAAARAKVFLLKGAPGAVWAIVAGAAIATAPMAG